MCIMYLKLRLIQLQLIKNRFFYAQIQVSSLYVFLVTRDAMIKKLNNKPAQYSQTSEKTVLTDVTPVYRFPEEESPVEAPDT